MPRTTELWTDGACAHNPGPGGWAFILVSRTPDGTIAKQLEGSGGSESTTNNQMELQAVIEGLHRLKPGATVTIYTDSAYVEEAFTKKWIAGWQRNGWKTSSKQPVKNQELWRELLAAIEPHTVTWTRVKGHSTSELNNRCDLLAVHQRDMYAGRIPVGTPPP